VGGWAIGREAGWAEGGSSNGGPDVVRRGEKLRRQASIAARVT
jgi:hypothetical protein